MTYKARAVPWTHGWELHIEGEGVTQVRTLDKAVQQVRDYVATMHEDDPIFAVRSDEDVHITFDLDGLEDDVDVAREAIAEAAAAQRRAAAMSRQVTRDLRDRGFSVTDTAAILGVSRGRVSQLTS